MSVPSGGPASSPIPPKSADGPEPWLDQRLRWRLRFSPRLSRLVTTIDLFAMESAPRRHTGPGLVQPRAEGWAMVALEQLDAARQAANERRLDDGWNFLHSAQRQAMNALTVSEAADRALALERECAAKLTGWRREAAAGMVSLIKAALLPAPAESDTDAASSAGAAGNPVLAPAGVRTSLIAVQRLLDDNSNNAYLRLRLVGQRLLLSTVLLFLLLVALGCLVTSRALNTPAFARVTVLQEPGTYTTVALLGVLGALLSFSIGAMATGAHRRIYELASGRFAATVARLLVGATAAIVVAIAVQSGVVALNPDWLLLLAVAAGFSERLVKRIIESLSADAEKPQPPPADSVGHAAEQPGT